MKERFLGAKIVVWGYADKAVEKKSVSSQNWGETMTVKNTSIIVPKNAFKPGELGYIYDEVFSSYRENPHAYETNFISVEKGDVVCDVGACEGFFTKLALNKGASKVIALEPLQRLVNSLQATFSSDVASEKVSVIKAALADTCGEASFKSDVEYICSSFISEDGNEKVPVYSLDTLVEKYKINKIDFIKMDIEDAEVKAIIGAKETIKKFRPKLSLAVYHSHENANKIAALLRDFDSLYEIKFGGCNMFEKPYRPFMLYAYPKGRKVSHGL